MNIDNVLINSLNVHGDKEMPFKPAPLTYINHLKYRPDIDGLRALAVLAVIFFHLGFKYINGGFVGVDIFFVISGYLITGQIRKDILTNSFSTKSFYLRRIRRIVPPLVVVLLAVSIASLFILKPQEMSSFARSLVSQPLSLQNFNFLAEGEYFVGANTKPLLHTWSLAVEEQFYLFWPLLFLLTRNIRYRFLLSIIFILIILSFFMNNLLINISPKSSFFLLPTRAWELATGGVAILIDEKRYLTNKLSSLSKKVIGFFGLLLIIISIFYINSKMPYPGNVALLPVMGTFLVLISKDESKISATSALSQPVLVNIGLISYSLYLWHWPLLAFSDQLELHVADPLYRVLFLTVVFFLSYASYRYLEVPIRKKIFFPRPKSLLIATALSFASLFIFGISVLETDGAAYRFSQNSKPFLVTSFHSRSDRCGFLFRTINPKGEICPLTKSGGEKNKVLLWGNSHADMWTGLLEKISVDTRSSLFLNAKNCRATTDSSFCNTATQDNILKFIKEKSITNVVLASTWYGSYDVSDQVFENQIVEIVSKITKQHANVWLVIDAPSGHELSPLTAFARNPRKPEVGFVLLNKFNSERMRELALFRKIAGTFPNVRIVDPTDIYCDQSKCFGGKGKEIWYRDDAHLTNSGANAARKKFMPIFSE